MFFKVLGVWLVLATAGFLNGVARGALLTPTLGESLARQMSSVTASILVLAVAYAFAPAFRDLDRAGWSGSASRGSR